MKYVSRHSSWSSLASSIPHSISDCGLKNRVFKPQSAIELIPGVAFAFAIRLAVVWHVQVAVPRLEALQHLIPLRQAGPNRFALLQPDLVGAFPDAIFLAAIVR